MSLAAKYFDADRFTLLAGTFSARPHPSSRSRLTPRCKHACRSALSSTPEKMLTAPAQISVHHVALGLNKPDSAILRFSLPSSRLRVLFIAQLLCLSTISTLLRSCERTRAFVFNNLWTLMGSCIRIIPFPFMQIRTLRPKGGGYFRATCDLGLLALAHQPDSLRVARSQNFTCAMIFLFSDRSFSTHDRPCP